MSIHTSSVVKILADKTSLGKAATKHVLYSMAREWEVVHGEMCALISSGLRF